MREDLLSNSDGLRITRVRSHVPCVWSGDTIRTGTHALAVRMHNQSGRTRLAWCRVGVLNTIADTFARFDATNHTVKSELSPTGDVKYNEVQGNMQSCAVCQQHIPKGTAAISFYQRRPQSFEGPKTSWVHTECLDAFATAIDDAWEYADTLLPQEL